MGPGSPGLENILFFFFLREYSLVYLAIPVHYYLHTLDPETFFPLHGEDERKI